ncbi:MULTISPECIES: MATE family efflux transporter [Clostridia]|uniref:MATE family efflux transporter n=1 Tax=Clostridia TaxID=186801 RepID=UPI001FAB6F29|nr:MATE family efflux transporter [Clostridium sp. 1001270J_160509_D11]
MEKLNLLKDKESKVFFHYLVPAVCSTLVTSVYLLVDTLIIGQGVGALGISALNIFMPFFLLFNGIGLLFGIGSGILISSEDGMGNKKKANQYFATGFVSILSIAIILGLIWNYYLQPLCVILGANSDTIDLVLEYGKCIMAFAPVFMMSNYFAPIVRNMKNPKLVMCAVLTGSVLNVILDYVFVFPMDMGMFGAAAATVIGSLTTLLVLSTHFIKKQNRVKINKETISLNLLAPIFKCGFSSLIMEVASGFVIFIFNIQILKYIGNNGIVVYGIISNCVLVGLALFNGVAQAAQPIIATNFGAGLNTRVKKVLKYALITTTIIGVSLFAVVFLFTGQIIKVFVQANSEILSVGIPALRLYLSAFCIMNINILISGYFQSVGKEKIAIYVSIVRGFLLNIILAFVLPSVLPATILWAIVPLSELITLIGIAFYAKNSSTIENTALNEEFISA